MATLREEGGLALGDVEGQAELSFGLADPLGQPDPVGQDLDQVTVDTVDLGPQAIEFVAHDAQLSSGGGAKLHRNADEGKEDGSSAGLPLSSNFVSPTESRRSRRWPAPLSAPEIPSSAIAPSTRPRPRPTNG